MKEASTSVGASFLSCNGNVAIVSEKHPLIWERQSRRLRHLSDNARYV
ncbi:hypothetical protein HMPREF3201_00988 [Megasphaera sp. MJR8396C]|nr:hypothetical protein HMPREF3201_00988 [Megasphaera sp. MJR8396C]